jgi:hypothetical protein
VKADYDWGEARLDAIEQLAGTKELPLVYVGGQLIGGPERECAPPARAVLLLAGLLGCWVCMRVVRVVCVVCVVCLREFRCCLFFLYGLLSRAD